MLSREDFIFTIGYDGETAIVDGKAKASYGAMGTAELAEAGLFRSAFASAVFSGKPEDLQAFASIFNARAGTSYTTEEDFKRLFGVKSETIRRVLVL
jgi:hypothetical protein